MTIDGPSTHLRAGKPDRLLGVAYACFAWIGVAFAITGTIGALPLELGDKQALGMLIGAPLMLVTFPVSLVAIGLSLFKRQERPLLAMSATLLLLSVAFVLASVFEAELVAAEVSTLAADAFVGAVATAFLFFPIRRWIRMRRELKPDSGA